jgi:hypothetical protein
MNEGTGLNTTPLVHARTGPILYLRNQVIANIVINFVLNGLIAFFSFRNRANVPVTEMAVDSLITVLIISYLVAWIAIPTVRREIANDKIELTDQNPIVVWRLRLPENSALRAGLIMLLVVLVFGGVLLSGAYCLLVPSGMTGSGYFILKAVYAGVCAGLAAAAAITSVFADVTLNSKTLA